MASGQALLQQLQARRLQAKASNSNGNGIIDIDSGNKRSVAIRSADTDTDTSTHPAQAATTDTFIEICQGPDCSGLGGGAALLEIEELVCEHSSNSNCANKPVLVMGGCRDFCTVGPNVYIGSRIKTNAIHGNQLSHHEHLDHVDSPSRCADVVDALYQVGGGGAVGTVTGVATLPPPPTPTNNIPKESNSLVSRMAQRRSERLRWEALRQVSRTSSSAQQQQQQQRRSDSATTTATTTTTCQDGTPQESPPLSSSSSSTAVAVPLQESVLLDTTTTAGATQTATNVPVYKSNDAIQELLLAATKAETNAAGSNLEMRARAQRRSERLFLKMQ
jgi:hypothetical protein